jgi:hypothetical protein
MQIAEKKITQSKIQGIGWKFFLTFFSVMDGRAVEMDNVADRARIVLQKFKPTEEAS